MSVEELKRSVAALSAGEQAELTAFLFHLRHQRDADYESTISRRMSDNDPSRWLTPEEFEQRLDAR